MTSSHGGGRSGHKNNAVEAEAAEFLDVHLDVRFSGFDLDRYAFAGALSDHIDEAITLDRMLEHDLETLLLKLMRNAPCPKRVLQTGAGKGTGIDAERGTNRASVMGQLEQHHLPGAGGKRDGFNNACGKNILTDGVSAAAGKMQSLIS